MELEKVIAGLGLNAVGFGFLYWYIKINLIEKDKEREQYRKINTENIDKLCLQIEKMVEKMQEVIAFDVEKYNTTNVAIEKIEEKLENQQQLLQKIKEEVSEIDIRTKLCSKISKFVTEKEG